VPLGGHFERRLASQEKLAQVVQAFGALARFAAGDAAEPAQYVDMEQYARHMGTPALSAPGALAGYDCFALCPRLSPSTMVAIIAPAEPVDKKHSAG